MREFPFISLRAALTVLRLAVACFFMAPATVRTAHGNIPQFHTILEQRGWPLSVLLVGCITAYELIVGSSAGWGCDYSVSPQWASRSFMRS